MVLNQPRHPRVLTGRENRRSPRRDTNMLHVTECHTLGVRHQSARCAGFPLGSASLGARPSRGRAAIGDLDQLSVAERLHPRLSCWQGRARRPMPWSSSTSLKKTFSDAKHQPQFWDIALDMPLVARPVAYGAPLTRPVRRCATCPPCRRPPPRRHRRRGIAEGPGRRRRRTASRSSPRRRAPTWSRC